MLDARRAYKCAFVPVYGGLGSMSHTCRPGAAKPGMCAYVPTDTLYNLLCTRVKWLVARWGDVLVECAQYTRVSWGQHTWNKLGRGGRWTIVAICHGRRETPRETRCLDPFINPGNMPGSSYSVLFLLFFFLFFFFFLGYTHHFCLSITGTVFSREYRLGSGFIWKSSTCNSLI